MNKDSPSNFRVALDSNFRDVNGNALYPDFDLTPLNQEAELSWNYVDLGEVVSGEVLLDYDALVLLLPRFTEAENRLFGLDFDHDPDARTQRKTFHQRPYHPR